MKLFLILFGGYMAFAGALMCARPLVAKKITDYWLKLDDETKRFWVVFPVSVGFLLFWAAPVSRAERFIQFLCVRINLVYRYIDAVGCTKTNS